MSGEPALAGRRVLVTRTRDGAHGLVDALQAGGADVVVVPLLTTVVLASPEAVREGFNAALGEAGGWAVFTSATAVRLVLGVLDGASFGGVRVAAVGPSTAEALLAGGLHADVTSSGAGAAELGASLAPHVAGRPVWYPAAEGASRVLEERLATAGARVHRWNLYRSQMPEDAPARLRAAMRRQLDAVTLTSGSTARHLASALGAMTLPASTVVACIGERTRETAVSLGFVNVVCAHEPSAAGIVAALVRRLGVAQPLR